MKEEIQQHHEINNSESLFCDRLSPRHCGYTTKQVLSSHGLYRFVFCVVILFGTHPKHLLGHNMTDKTASRDEVFKSNESNTCSRPVSVYLSFNESCSIRILTFVYVFSYASRCLE